MPPAKSSRNIKLKLKKERELKKRRRNKQIGLFLVLVQIIVAVIFFALLIKLNILPDKYLYMLMAIVSLITCFNLFSQLKKTHIAGKILAVILSLLLGFISFYVAKTNDMLSSITQNNVVKDSISIIVKKSDKATTLTDLKKYEFGYNSVVDTENTTKALENINTNLGTTVSTTEYDSWNELINALYNNEVKAIILNEAFRSAFEETFPTFDKDTKIIHTVSFETKIEMNAKEKKVNEEPFCIYVAGNDEEGLEINQNGRNDVNITAVINPKTRQVLLVTTPRDYFVYIDSGSGAKGYDKLTHAGKFGVRCSMNTLETLYNTSIDYFIKVNFTGTIEIIDALDGITVDSEVAFTTTPDTNPYPITFKVGENELSGVEALAFCRERQAFGDGDFQRGRNQMIAIKAMIKKATSASMIANYSDVMDSVSGFFSTNMPASSITGLIKGTIEDPTEWNVQSYSVTGEPDMKTCQIFDGVRSVVIPDENSITIAKELIKKIRNGEVFDVDNYVAQKQSIMNSTQTPSIK